MPETSTGLLSQLLDNADGSSWERFIRVYNPLFYGWLKRRSIPHQDADDIVQNVLRVVVQQLPQFRHNGRSGAFRCWLRTILANELHVFSRSQRVRTKVCCDSEILERLGMELADPRSELSLLWDHEHDQFIINWLKVLLDRIRGDFQPQTWEAFCRFVLEGQPPRQVAADLGFSLGSVHNAKYRVLKRLREELPQEGAGDDFFV